VPHAIKLCWVVFLRLGCGEQDLPERGYPVQKATVPQHGELCPRVWTGAFSCVKMLLGV